MKTDSLVVFYQALPHSAIGLAMHYSVFTSVPTGSGTHSCTVSRTITTCILVLSPIDEPCSRCSSLLSFDNKCLTCYSSSHFSMDRIEADQIQINICNHIAKKKLFFVTPKIYIICKSVNRQIRRSEVRLPDELPPEATKLGSSKKK